jgi:hypothetical protein
MTAPTYTAEQVAAAVKAALEEAAEIVDSNVRNFNFAHSAKPVKLYSLSSELHALAADPQAVARFVEAGRVQG